MRHAILADVHANDYALAAVLTDAEQQGVTSFHCLGDVVGYHAQPHEVVATIRARSIPTVVGNHDRMATAADAPLGGPLARAAMLWTRRILSEDEVGYLRGLPTERRLGTDALLVHSVPWSLDHRLMAPSDLAEAAMRIRDSHPGIQIVFTGHTHVAGFAQVSQNGAVTRAQDLSVALVEGDGLWFVNPGSVGLPRDGAEGARYAIYDDATRRVAFRCARYDMEAINLVNHACGLLTRVPEGPRTIGMTPAAGIFVKLTESSWP